MNDKEEAAAADELLGRDTECRRIHEAIAAAASGHSNVLVIRGEAGIGKTALLRDAAERAASMTILRARGIESESELAFAALGDFLRPALERMRSIPEPQGDALAGALALGPATSGDRFAICAATLSLIAATAESAPVLGLIDDAQWLDTSSAEALLFAARRLDSEGVALLFAVREGERGPFESTGLDEVVLHALDEEDAVTLLARRVHPPPSPEVAARLAEATGGNPLALVEIPTVLSPSQLAGKEPLEEPLPVTQILQRAFLNQIEALPDDTQTALLVAAASETGKLDEIVLALGVLGIPGTALDAAEEGRLLSIEDGLVEFRHPLLRAAVYHEAPAGAREAAHRALAETSGEARAWHLAAAAPDLDEEVASALEEAALDARGRGGHAEAALALERAARLTADNEERARRLFESADDSRIAGQADRALALLDEALVLSTDPHTRARIQHLRGAVEMWYGKPREAYRLLVNEAPRVAELDPAKASRMLTDASWACFMAADIAAGLETAERAQSVSEGAGESTQIHAAAVLGLGLLLNGQARQALPLLARFEPLLEAVDFERVRQLSIPAQALTWIEEYDLGRGLLRRMIEAARERSALGFLPYALASLSELDYRTGNMAAAYAGAGEAIRIAKETGQDTTHGFGLVCAARVEAVQGREDACREHAATALEIAPHGIGAIPAYALSTLALLELGAGRSDETIALLEQLASRAEAVGLGEPAVIQWAPDLIEAYVRAGRDDEARAALEVFEAQAEQTGRNWALAASARCRGLLAGADELDAYFARATELHRTTPTPFELARSELCFGEQLRRHGRRVDARQPLRSALEAFEQLGAEAWAERARVELGASGETARRRDPAAAGQLTPQELQVALVVSQGATNREAGAALFLSPKTIEAHLGRIYRKLDVRSRTELARLLAAEGALADAAA